MEIDTFISVKKILKTMKRPSMSKQRRKMKTWDLWISWGYNGSRKIQVSFPESPPEYKLVQIHRFEMNRWIANKFKFNWRIKKIILNIINQLSISGWDRSNKLQKFNNSEFLWISIGLIIYGQIVRRLEHLIDYPSLPL